MEYWKNQTQHQSIATLNRGLGFLSLISVRTGIRNSLILLINIA